MSVSVQTLLRVPDTTARMGAHEHGKSATQGHAPARQLLLAPAYLRADCTCSEPKGIFALFYDMAVTCVQKHCTRLLITVHDHDPASERALRDALTVMILAGIPSGFRLAIVATSERAAVRYRQAQRDFCAAGVTTRLFGSESDATRWLTSRAERTRSRQS